MPDDFSRAGTAQATGPGISRAIFGYLPGGEVVEAITLTNAAGIQVTVMTYGAGIQAVLVPDRDGVLADVALGHATLEAYVQQPQFIGATVGRVANRIAAGRFTLDGHEYRVPANNGPNALHGGPRGFDKVNWQVIEPPAPPSPLRVTLGHVSPDGDQGFPGSLRVTATYELTDDGCLRLEYIAAADRTTVVNISNHAYWNLAGEGTPGGAMDHRLTIYADHYLPTDASAIPTGELRPVAGTPFDFRSPAVIGERVRDARDDQIAIGHGYDHNWIVADRPAAEPQRIALLEHPGSGRTLEISSNQPGVQFYSGNFLDATSIGKSGRLYRMGDAVAIEPQMFPDTPNQPAFGSLRLDPGEVYRNVLVYRFSTSEAG